MENLNYTNSEFNKLMIFGNTHFEGKNSETL